MDFSLWWFAYIAVGLFSGFVAGLLGLGGGAVLVPMLASMFAAQGFSTDHVLHLALGTSMATIIFTAAASLRTHDAHGAVLWPVVRSITPGILAGTFLGTFIARFVPTRELAAFFTLFIAYVAIQMAVNFRPKPSRQLPGTLAVAGVGAGIGTLSALVAIGGGSLTVPFLTWCNVRVQQAIGTSAAVGLPIALGGTAGYLWNGLHAGGLPQGAFGFIYLPALGFVVAASVLTAPLGARLAHRLPVKLLKRIFAGVLIALCGKMLVTIL